MDEVYPGGDVFDLIGLQVPDEVPADVFGHLFVFFNHLLHPVFAEIPLAFIV